MESMSITVSLCRPRHHVGAHRPALSLGHRSPVLCVRAQVLISVSSRYSDPRNVNGSRKGLCDGTNTFGPEAEVCLGTVRRSIDTD